MTNMIRSLKAIVCFVLLPAVRVSALVTPQIATPAASGVSRGTPLVVTSRGSGAGSLTELRSAILVMKEDSGPAILDRPEVVKEEKVEDSTKEKEGVSSGGWMVRLYNDPMNKREFVARCLTEITGMSDGAAYQTMMQAHQHGLAVVGRYNFEIAELYHKSLSEHGLFVDMVPVDKDE